MDTMRCSEMSAESHIIGVTFMGVSSEDPLTNDKMLEIMRKLKEGQVKEEDTETESVPKSYEKAVKVSELRYTQGRIDQKFRDGRDLEELVGKLQNGKVALSADFLKLSVVHWPTKGYFSIDNRMLWRLKRFQEMQREMVEIKVRVFPLTEDFVNLMQSHPA